MKQFSFHKKEKLKSRKLTDSLFTSGKSFTVFPIKVFYKLTEEPQNFSVKVGVAVSGRNFKKATNRNRIKRLLRETYRLQKEKLLEVANNKNKQLAVFFLYVDKTMPEFELLKTTMLVALEKLTIKISETTSANT
jgi:ribonuclease P protein component